MRILKRNGSLQAFDSNKIRRAVVMAFHASETPVPELDNLLDAVVEGISKQPGDTISVEVIQDIVESVLMASGYHEVAKKSILYRDFRARFRATKLSVDTTLISEYVQAAKYARYRPDLGRREVYSETVDRVVAMHTLLYPNHKDIIDSAFSSVYTKEVLPSMRSMQFAGPAIWNENARLYNCAYTLCQRPRVFSEIFYLLLCGVGVGYSVQWKHIRQLPRMARKHDVVSHFTIPDTIEGWACALEHLIQCAINGYYAEFDYSLIRPAGSPLRVSGGRAPGHLPLKEMLEKVRRLLPRGRQMRPIEVHDIICHTAEAVLSGGIRRSSLISLFSPDDTEMMYAKASGNFDPSCLNTQRMMANNSVMLLRSGSQHALDTAISLAVDGYGEPGFYFSDDEDHGPNPCGEIGLDPGNGFQFCNLTEINGATCRSADDFHSRCRDAAIIGTLQAGYTNFKYLTPETQERCERDALLGVSITGIMDQPDLLTDERVLREGANVVKMHNAFVSAKLGINKAVRLTTVKPSGTASLLLGCVGSGIHLHHSKRYFRRITANPNERPYQYFRSLNPHMCQVKGNGDSVITFPVETRGLTLRDMEPLDFLRKVGTVYKCWVEPGTAHGRLTHNVSCTVTVDDPKKLLDYIWKNRDTFAALSFAPPTLDKIYPFAPRESVVSESDEIAWNGLIKLAKTVDWRKLREDEDNTKPTNEPACAGGVCEI